MAKFSDRKRQQRLVNKVVRDINRKVKNDGRFYLTQARDFYQSTGRGEGILNIMILFHDKLNPDIVYHNWYSYYSSLSLKVQLSADLNQFISICSLDREERFDEGGS